jgi:hypothetical protein
MINQFNYQNNTVNCITYTHYPQGLHINYISNHRANKQDLKYHSNTHDHLHTDLVCNSKHKWYPQQLYLYNILERISNNQFRMGQYKVRTSHHTESIYCYRGNNHRYMNCMYLWCLHSKLYMNYDIFCIEGLLRRSSHPIIHQGMFLGK